MPDTAPKSQSDIDALLARDAATVWHPYASMSNPPQARLVDHADGVRLHFADGSSAIDAMSSWWCMIHGYRNPTLDASVRDQLGSMSHVMFGGLTHQPAIELAELLVSITPDPLRHVFFCDSGSVSVEVAIKLALQYQFGRGARGRTRLLALRGGYHGDTFGAMSVCDPITGMHSMFTGALAEQVFAPRPPAGFDRPADDPQLVAWVNDVERLVVEHSDELAAIIVEPILQGAGGMYAYSPQCLRALRTIADAHGLVLIFDEIATGFARTGELFAANHADMSPDIMCVGKALTGGYLSLAATLCSTHIAQVVSDGPGGALMHGPTFMGNPLACAVAKTSIEMLLNEDWRSKIRRIERGLTTGLAPARALPGVKDVRVLGAVGVVQVESPVHIAAVTDAALKRGVWVRPFLDLVYTMPPYITTGEEIATICAAICDAVDEVVS